MLVGPSKTGKSHWARSLGDHIYFGNNYSLDLWRPEASYVVFDDIELKYVHAYKYWLGSMGEFTDTDKFRAKRTIVWGPFKCCIILCNEGLDWRYTEEWKRERSWFETNVEVIEVRNKLF